MMSRQTAGTIAGTALQAAALAALTRRIGARRLGRAALVLAEAYLAHSGPATRAKRLRRKQR
jgi:hypothetical protein